MVLHNSIIADDWDWKKLPIEEGSMTGWLDLLLRPYVDELIVASTVAAALITPVRFSKKSKLCAYAGLSVFQQRSAGKVLRSGATRGGNQDLKRALMQAANAIGRMKADKHELASCHQSLKSRGFSAPPPEGYCFKGPERCLNQHR